MRLIVDLDTEIFADLMIYRGGPNTRVFFSSELIEESSSTAGSEHLLMLMAVQAIDPTTEESPIGCNACDLADLTLRHKANCAVNFLPAMHLSVESVHSIEGDNVVN